MNLNLKLKILEKHRYQVDFAHKVGIDEERLSRIIHGRAIPSADEKQRISRALGVKAENIFNGSKRRTYFKND